MGEGSDLKGTSGLGGVAAAERARQGDVGGEGLRLEIGDGAALGDRRVLRRHHAGVARQPGVVALLDHAIAVFAFRQRGARVLDLDSDAASCGVGVGDVAQGVGQRPVVDGDGGVVFGRAPR